MKKYTLLKAYFDVAIFSPFFLKDVHLTPLIEITTHGTVADIY